MPDYDEIRRGLAQAMGWRYLAVLPPDEFPHISPGRKVEPCPDPLNSERDAESLFDWLRRQGWHLGTCFRDGKVDLAVYDDAARTRCLGWAVATPADAPDNASRRRRALVEAAWQAVQRARS